MCGMEATGWIPGVEGTEGGTRLQSSEQKLEIARGGERGRRGWSSLEGILNTLNSEMK